MFLCCILIATVLISCSSSDKNFIGSWSYKTSIPSANDLSMMGQICEINNYNNTKESYKVNILNIPLIFQKVDNYTLKNGKIVIKFDKNSDCIIVDTNNGSKLVYSRMK